MGADSVILENWVAGTPNYKARAYAMLGIGLAYTLFVLVTTTMFLVVARNRRSGLEKRSVLLTTIQALGCYLVGVDGLVTAALNNWACFGKLWLFNIGFTMSLGAMSARAFHLYVVYRMHDLANRLGRIQKQSPSSGASAHGSELSEGGRFVMRKPSRLDILRPPPYDRIRLEQLLLRHKRLLRFTTDRMLLLYLGAVLLVTVAATFAINATDHQFALHPVNTVCQFMWGFIPALVIIVLYFFVAFPVILWRVWRNNDAYGIRNDLIICDTVGIVVMVLTLVWVLRLQETQQIWPGLSFVCIYALVIHISSVLTPLVHAMRHIRHATDPDPMVRGLQFSPVYSVAVSSRRAEFNRMLDSAIEYCRFRSFAASCFCSELTAFLEEYHDLKMRTIVLLDNQYPTGSGKISKGNHVSSDTATISQSIADTVSSAAHASVFVHRSSSSTGILETVRGRYADIDASSLVFPLELAPKISEIYAEFVDPASLTCVNASSLIVRRIAERIGANHLHISLFDELKDEVLLMLYSDVYTRFIRKMSFS